MSGCLLAVGALSFPAIAILTLGVSAAAIGGSTYFMYQNWNIGTSEMILKYKYNIIINYYDSIVRVTLMKFVDIWKQTLSQIIPVLNKKAVKYVIMITPNVNNTYSLH